MLIEAICEYRMEFANETGSIERLRFVDLGTPLTDRDYIVSRGCTIAVFGNQILSFRVSEPTAHRKFEKNNETGNGSAVMGAVPKVFSLQYGPMNISTLYDTQATGGQGTVYRDPRTKNIEMHSGNTVKEFESIYPTTDIYFTESNLVFALEQPSRTVRQIMSELKKMHPSLSMRDGRYFTGSLGGDDTQYIVKGIDGEILVDISILKKENVRGFYHNDNRSSVCLARNRTDTLKTKIGSNDRNHLAASTDSSSFEVPDCSITAYSTGKLETIFEFSRSKEYVVLIKAFLKNLKRSRYCFLKHFYIQSLDTFYFIAFKIGHNVTLVVSRRLYDYTKLVNLLHSCGRESVAPGTGFLNAQYSKYGDGEEVCQSDSEVCNFCTRCLSIPDLGPEGSLSINYRGESLIARYKMKETGEMCAQVVRSLFECDGVVLEEDEDSFWDIQSIINRLDPLRFPGLIISPLSSEMKYLLEGPYPFIVSSGEWIEPANKVVRMFKMLRSDENRASDRHPHACPDSEDTETVGTWQGESLRNSRFIRSLKNTIRNLVGTSRKASAASRTDLFLRDKGKFISNIVSTKSHYFLPPEVHTRPKHSKDASQPGPSSLGVFPTSFDAPTLIEKYFVNEVKPFGCVYTFDLSGQTEFFPPAKVSAKNALSLWMMIYPGEVDYESLLRARDCDSLYLARRACIDRNARVVQRILRRVAQSGNILAAQMRKGLRLGANKVSCRDKWVRYGSRRLPRSLPALVRGYMSKKSSGGLKITRRPTRLNDILSVVGNYDKWNLHEINNKLALEMNNSDVDVPQNTSIGAVEYSSYTKVSYKGNVYNIMTLENILGCIHNEFYNDQLRASVLAHFQKTNLPPSPPKYTDSGDFTVTL